MEVVPLTPAHWEAVSAIFREGLATGDASFEEACPDWAEWDSSHLAICRFVALAHDEVVGWAALAPVSERCVYGGVAEVSVYVAAGARRIGVGSALLAALVAASERDGLWTLQAGVFPENEASIVLHKKHGFRVVGTRERLGQLHGVWRDVVLLERRSPHVD
ncbi:MAG: GNAT family N-acetyltransferase [Planctomycetota bacterium]